MTGLLGLAAWLASAGSAGASIQISQSDTFALFADASFEHDMSSSTGDDEPQPIQPDQLFGQLAAPIDGSGMTCSASGASGTSAAQALPASSPVFQQEPLSGRLAGEAKLILPAGFILGLLRPPQILS